MNFNEYQDAAWSTAQYPDKGINLIYPALGLAGESGEAVDKIKKYWRNFGHTSAAHLDERQLDELSKELGDVLWYVAALASEMGYTLESIAEANVTKLLDRQARGVIKSQGDNR
jgi:NTP pyrophosphatase (non-canonical NTP hydrolase)